MCARSIGPDYGSSAMAAAKNSGGDVLLTAEDAEERKRARDHMIARQKLIEAMIRNNELQLKNESARGGAEIEMQCALRDVAMPGAGSEARAELERVSQRLLALQTEHLRLVAEREWLNTSLLEFDSDASADEHQRSGH